MFVPFGGHYGDCGNYHGLVAALDLYFSAGTTEGARSWQDGEGVFQVGPDLVHSQDPREFFAPSDWKQLDEDDLDLGGVTPLPLASPGRRCPCYWRWGRTEMRTCSIAPIWAASPPLLRCVERHEAQSSPSRGLSSA